MPLVDDKPFVHSSRLDSRLSLLRATTWASRPTPTSSAWSGRPSQDVRLRGSFARAVRAPNVVELYSPAAVGLDGTYGTDPCAGHRTPAVLAAAQCAQTGVSRRQYRQHLAESGRSIQRLARRQSDLEPETALTTSFGIGWTPALRAELPGASRLLRYPYRERHRAIGGTVILEQCATNGIFCNFIHRDPLQRLAVDVQRRLHLGSAAECRRTARKGRRPRYVLRLRFRRLRARSTRSWSAPTSTSTRSPPNTPWRARPTTARGFMVRYLQFRHRQRGNTGFPLAPSRSHHLGDSLEGPRCDARLALLTRRSSLSR